jgi:hypothetical protein
MKPAGQMPAAWPPRKIVSVVAEGHAVHDPRPLSTGPVIVVDVVSVVPVLPETLVEFEPVLLVDEELLAPLPRVPEPPHPLHTATPMRSA